MTDNDHMQAWNDQTGKLEPRDDSDGLQWIRLRYGVPAYLGWRMAFTHDGYSEGTIVGSNAGHVIMQTDGTGETVVLHPTWHTAYLGKPKPDTSQTDNTAGQR